MITMVGAGIACASCAAWAGSRMKGDRGGAAKAIDARG
jgi:hypothetical protein